MDTTQMFVIESMLPQARAQYMISRETSSSAWTPSAKLNLPDHFSLLPHSLGGIVVKEALRSSHSFRNHQKHLHEIYKSTKGIIFFGTPHSGADPRSFIHHIAEKVLKATGFAVNQQIIDTLLPTSERLKELRAEFSPMAHQNDWIIYCFQERYGIPALNNNKVGDRSRLQPSLSFKASYTDPWCIGG
jgi:hypothetical protein